MLEDIEQKVKEALLESLIDKMSDDNGSRLKPGLAVKVAAPDKEGLAAGLDKAKEELPGIPEGKDETTPPEDDDESRLLALLADDDDDDKK